MEYPMEELIPVVTRLSEKYTRKESSSISYETAEQLMGAVIYCIDAFGWEEIGTEVRTDHRTLSAMEAYKAGADLVVDRVKKAQKKYNQVIETFCDYGNLAYHDTFVLGIPAFFRTYDVRFCPQDTILTLDYPTLVSVNEDKSGIRAIAEYINYIELEQKFLGRLPEDFVRSVLREYHTDYKNLFINLAGTIIRALLNRIISQRRIQNEITSMGKEEGKRRLSELLQYVIQKEYDGNMELYQYLLSDMEDYWVYIKTVSI